MFSSRDAMSYWDLFVCLFVEAFIVLRRTATLIIFYSSNIDITFLDSNAHQWFCNVFKLTLTEDQVIDELVANLNYAGSSWRNVMVNWHHALVMRNA